MVQRYVNTFWDQILGRQMCEGKSWVEAAVLINIIIYF